MESGKILTIMFAILLIAVSLPMASAAWFNDSWNYKQEVTTNSASASDLANFPYFLSIDTQTLITEGKMNDDCSDLRITNSAEDTVLAYEIVSGCNTTTTQVWAKIPSLATNNSTNIYFYYGNPTAVDGQNISGLWNEYKLVWHGESIGTSKGNNFTNNNGATFVSGVYGNAGNFVKTSSQFLSQSSDVYNFVQQGNTITAWFKDEGMSSQYDTYLGKWNEGGNRNYAIFRDSANTVAFYPGTSGGSGAGSVVSTPIQANQYFYYSALLNSTGTYQKANASTNWNFQPSAINGGTNNEFRIGGSQTFGGSVRYSNAEIDEVRIYNGTLTNDWLFMDYSQGRSTFYTFGSETNQNTINLTYNSPSDSYVAVRNPVIFNITTSSTDNIKNVSLYINGTLNETNSSGFNGTYIFSKNLSIGEYTWSILVFNEANQSSQGPIRTLTKVRYIENSVTYTTPITEGTPSVFTLNLTTDGTGILSSYLNYSGLYYATSTYDYGDYVIFNRTLTSPLVTNSEIKTFNFVINYTDFYAFGTTQYNQTVNDVLIDNCSTYNYTLYNFTIVDEESQIKINESLINTYSEIDMQLKLSDGTTLQSYSTNFNNTNPFAICISSNLSTNTQGLLVDAQIQYSADGYVKEFYNIQNENITTADLNTNITLYDLNTSQAQEFLITYTDTNFNPVQDAIILVKRKYISEGVFKTVEIPITDANGQTLANLVLSNVIYSFSVMKDGVLLATFDNQVAYCDNIATGDCQIVLNTYSTTSLPDTYSNVGDYIFSIDYNKTSRLLSATFSVASGQVATNFLNVTQYGTNGATSVCTDTLVTASGTLTCTIPSQYENSTIVVELSRDGDLVGRAVITLNAEPDEIYGNSRVFLALVAFLLIITIGVVDHPAIQVVLMIIGTVILVAANLMNSGPASSLIGSGATALFFIVALILILVKGGRR